MIHPILSKKDVNQESLINGKVSNDKPSSILE